MYGRMFRLEDGVRYWKVSDIGRCPILEGVRYSSCAISNVHCWSRTGAEHALLGCLEKSKRESRNEFEGEAGESEKEKKRKKKEEPTVRVTATIWKLWQGRGLTFSFSSPHIVCFGWNCSLPAFLIWTRGFCCFCLFCTFLADLFEKRN